MVVIRIEGWGRKPRGAKLRLADIAFNHRFEGVEQVAGVTFDGANVWFASGDRLNALDPETGKPMRSIAVPAHAGTAFDGTHLYQIAEKRIQKIDPKTGRVLASIPSPGDGKDSGMAWAEGTLWVGQYTDRKIHQIDPETGRILRTIESDRFVKLDTARWLRWVHALRSNWLTDAELAAMRVPTLVLATGLDSWHAGPTVGMAQALAARLPRAELSVIENYGTFFCIERPELFTGLAGGFLRRMSLAAPGE